MFKPQEKQISGLLLQGALSATKSSSCSHDFSFQCNQLSEGCKAKVRWRESASPHVSMRLPSPRFRGSGWYTNWIYTWNTGEPVRSTHIFITQEELWRGPGRGEWVVISSQASILGWKPSSPPQALDQTQGELVHRTQAARGDFHPHLRSMSTILILTGQKTAKLVEQNRKQ